MKNILMVGVVVVVLVVAFFISKKVTPTTEEVVTGEQVAPESVDTQEEGMATENKTSPEPVKNPVVNKKYSYTNTEFKFAVDLPNLIATRKPETPLYMSVIFTFGAGDQSNIEESKRVPNSMALYVWNDIEQFTKMMSDGVKLPSEKINGKNFDVYSFTDENMTTYHYTIKVGNDMYDIGVRNKNDITKFYLLN